MSSETFPCRSASRPSASLTMRGARTGDFCRAARRCDASGPLTTPTGIRSGAFSRNANPNARARISGKPKTQKIASVSRMNSLVRALVSSTMAGRTPLDIAKLPAGERNKQVLQRCRVGGQRDQLRSVLLHQVDQLRYGFGQRVDAQLPCVSVRTAAVTGRQCQNRLRRQRRFAGEFDDVRCLELGDQFLRCAQGNEVPVIDDGDVIAQPLRFFHVMSGQQNRAALLPKAGHDFPQLQAALRIQSGRRLVEKEDVGIAAQRPRPRQALLLTAGKLAHARVALLVQRQVVHHGFGIRSGAIEGAEEAHGLVHGQLFVELGFLQRDSDPLAQVAFVTAPGHAQDLHVAAVRNGEALQDLDGCRFPGAIRAEQTEALICRNGEIQAVDSFHFGVIVLQTATGDDCVFHGANDTLIAGPATAGMRAIVFDQPGDESVLHIGEVDPPPLVSGAIRIRVHATAVNRADLLQRQGLYPPPPGASPILGMECAGEVIEVASDVRGWRTGDRVMALLPGGSYAEEAVVDAGSAMRVPDLLSWEEAGAMPEVVLTAYLK